MRTNCEKRGQISIFVIIAVVLVAAIVLIAVLLSLDEPEEIIIECYEDSECVPSECCNAMNCVPINKTPDCTGVECIAPFCESFPGNLLGCGAPEDRGNCSCINNKCGPVFPNG